MAFVAIDSGRKFWVSEDGIAANAYVAREPGVRAGTMRVAKDFIRLADAFFARGVDVVTEAPTVGSFGTKGRDGEMAAVLALYPGRKLWVLNSHTARNECRKDGSHAEKGPLPDDEAAAAIWRVFDRTRGKPWRLPDESLRPWKEDPLRPNLLLFKMLRNHGYPAADMEKYVWRFLPPFYELGDDHQRRVVGDEGGYAKDRAAAFIFALREPSSQSRTGFERVIGAYRERRGTLYSQTLVTGTPDQDYRRGHHFTGLTFSEWRSAMRRLRSDLLAGIGNPAEAGIVIPARRRPPGIVYPAPRVGISDPGGRQTSLFD